MLLGLSSLAAPAVPSLEARMNADTAGKDMHAQATTRATFQQTYECQMDALEGKLKKFA